jgi:kynureninase
LAQQGYELQLMAGPEELQAALNERVAAVVLSHVNYRTGFLWPMQDTTAKSTNTVVW